MSEVTGDGSGPPLRAATADVGSEPLLPPGSYLFHADQLEEALGQLAGAVSGQFLREDAEKEMPSREVAQVMAEFVVRSPEIFGRAAERATEARSRPSEGPRLFEFNAVKPPPVIALMAPQKEYGELDPAISNATVVISQRGEIIKDRYGQAGRRATDEERLEAQPIWPNAPGVEDAQEGKSMFPMPEMDPGLKEGFELEEGQWDPFLTYAAVVISLVALVCSIAAVVIR